MANTYELRDRHAIVTGAARGIGRAIAELLLANGASVTVWDLAQASIPGARGLVVDVGDLASVEAAVSLLPAAAPTDILVNCAGYLGQAQSFASHPKADWERIIRVNLAGTMNVTQCVLPRMLTAGGGRIVNMASLAGKEGLPGITAYSAASGGVVSFTKALGRELAGSGIYVNCVAPGPIDTDMIRGLGSQTVDAMISDSPLKRLGTTGEVAHLVAWLCTDASRFNTGAVFDMSGGRARY